jgi:hypothetical protein
MELNLNGKIARMFSTVTSVATPHDVTLQELQVEVSYPANAETEARVLTGPYRMFSQPGGLWANRVFDLFRLVHPRQADSV